MSQETRYYVTVTKEEPCDICEGVGQIERIDINGSTNSIDCTECVGQGYIETEEIREIKKECLK